MAFRQSDSFAFAGCEELAAFYGYADTYTETFATANGYYFEPFEEEVPEDTTEEIPEESTELQQ